jgi:hypothetical protein
MTKSKNHNSIIFLTTLGVYLGLVLAGGASSQIFAHTALTRNFDIQDEVEVKDDLDKNPDGERELDEYASMFEDSVRTTLAYIKNPAIQARDFWSYDYVFSLDPMYDDITQIAGSNEGGFYLALTSRHGRSLNSIFLHGADISTRRPAVSVSFRLFPAEAHFELSQQQFSKAEANTLAVYYDQILSKLKERRLIDLRRVIYSNTQVFANDNKVSIVSHLPRASIDPLLADKNAQ